MTWDLILMRVPDEAQSFNDLPHGFTPAALGSLEEVIALLRQALPAIEVIGIGNRVGCNADAYHIGIDLVHLDEDEAPNIHLLGVHVSGSETALLAVKAVWQTLMCAAFDSGTGERLDRNADAPLRSFRAWKAYRDHVIR
jgi:hypothetical protein